MAGSFCIPATLLHAQNLITNPGFETAPAAGGDHLQGSGAGSAYYGNSFASGSTQTIQSWTFGYDGTVATSGGSAAQVEWFKSGTAAATSYVWDATPPHGGTYAVELNTDAPKGRMYAQPTLTSALTIGTTYKLSFWVAPENAWPTGSGVTQITGQVTVNGGAILTFTLAAPASTTTSTWTQESVNFVATGTAPVIRIWDGTYLGSGTSTNYSSSVGGANDINLDDVSLTAAVTPEPATLAGAFLLFGLAGWTERRRLRGLAWRLVRLKAA
ncbi:MAG TPA: hypothetical protein VG733_00685 [Chthoniobacteraceae bacterium]|nr:hypothetical protein [Chthoniobacteraceae bacterium]